MPLCLFVRRRGPSSQFWSPRLRYQLDSSPERGSFRNILVPSVDCSGPFFALELQILTQESLKKVICKISLQTLPGRTWQHMETFVALKRGTSLALREMLGSMLSKFAKNGVFGSAGSNFNPSKRVAWENKQGYPLQPRLVCGFWTGLQVTVVWVLELLITVLNWH